MKRNYAFYLLCALALASCSKETDLYEGSQDGDQQENTTGKTVEENVKEVFGIDFDPNQDWVMIKNGKVTVTADAADFVAVKAQVLTAFPSSWSKDALVLNEAKVESGKSVELTFDAPDNTDTLVVALLNSNNQYRAKTFVIGTEKVSFASAAASRKARRVEAATVTLGEGKLSSNATMLLEGNSTWAGSKWNDMLYETSITGEAISDFTNEERQTLNAIINANVPEMQKNTQRIKASDIYIDTNNYFTATGEKPILVTPVACGAYYCGWESLYYYYYNTEDIVGMSDAQRAEYLQSLPKFKLLQSGDVFGNQSLATTEERVNDSRNRYTSMLNRVNKNHTYTLAYFGNNDNLQQNGTVLFPEGYRIGFMLRIDSITNTAVLNNKSRAVELYADKMLNDEVNYYNGWKNANLGKNMSRAAIFGANGSNYIGFEDYTDDDFNDILFEVTGGVEIIDERLLLDRQVYTMSFEDTHLGDYDLNDVVIKAQRIDLTHVKFSLEATGAKDELYLRWPALMRNAAKKLNETTEVHAIFGQGGARDFINTVEGAKHWDAVQDTLEVPVAFTFSDVNNGYQYLPYIYNATKGYEVKIAVKGQDPHGIVIPWDFLYPRERVCVGGIEKVGKTVAYKRFNNWGQNKVNSTDWYKYPDMDLVYTKSHFE